MITLEGYITAFEITPASIDDREGVKSAHAFMYITLYELIRIGSFWPASQPCCHCRIAGDGLRSRLLLHTGFGEDNVLNFFGKALKRVGVHTIE